METPAPGSPQEAAALLRDANDAGRRVRFVGGRTKLAWGTPADPPDVELSTAGLDRVIEHNAADLTAIVESGMALATFQEQLAGAGQMLALDPPDPGGRATIGGVVATSDTGPLRHRYGAPRDQLLGIRVALADGTLAHSGGKVIKNVAGYDLAKLFAGSFGTLGLVVEVSVRLHPVPALRATAVGTTADPDVAGRAARAAGDAPLELEALDVRWEDGAGTLLARVGGVAAEARARSAGEVMSAAGLDDVDVRLDDEYLWAAQRGAQRPGDGDDGAGAVVRVSGVRTDLPLVIRAARALGATVAGRAGLGLFWVGLPPADDGALVASIEELRRALEPRPCVVLDAAEAVRRKVAVWGDPPPGALSLMRRVKERFDPLGTCNPGLYVGGM